VSKSTKSQRRSAWGVTAARKPERPPSPAQEDRARRDSRPRSAAALRHRGRTTQGRERLPHAACHTSEGDPLLMVGRSRRLSERHGHGRCSCQGDASSWELAVAGGLAHVTLSLTGRRQAYAAFHMRMTHAQSWWHLEPSSACSKRPLIPPESTERHRGPTTTVSRHCQPTNEAKSSRLPSDAWNAVPGPSHSANGADSRKDLTELTVRTHTSSSINSTTT
jgi:hypothetical protein